MYLCKCGADSLPLFGKIELVLVFVRYDFLFVMMALVSYSLDCGNPWKFYFTIVLKMLALIVAIPGNSILQLFLKCLISNFPVKDLK